MVNIPVGGTLTYLASGVVAANAGDTLTNTASVTPPTGFTDSDGSDNTATDIDNVNRLADLSVTKNDGVTSVIGGGSTTYTIVIGNSGTAFAAGARVVDPLPSTVASSSWTCVASAGSACSVSSGTGAIDTLVDVAPNGTVTFSLTYTILDVAGDLVNVVAVTAPLGFIDANGANNVSVDTDSITPVTDLQISKTDGQTSVVAGDAVTYTITVNNVGQFSVTGASVKDTFPPGLTGVSWTCTPGAGATCPALSGTTSIDGTMDLAAGSSATFSVAGTVDPAATGTLENTATIAVPTGVIDSTPANDSATDVDTIIQNADLDVTKSDGQIVAVPGEPVAYSVVVTNNGPSAVVGASVSDAIPASLTGATWTCSGAGGGVCGVAAGCRLDRPNGRSAGRCNGDVHDQCHGRSRRAGSACQHGVGGCSGGDHRSGAGQQLGD